MVERVVDLSHEVFSGLAHFITPPLVVLDYHQRRWNRLNFEPPAPGFDTKLLTMLDHYGTHVDAPNHIHAGAASIEQLPLEKFVGEAVLLDVTDRSNGAVEVADLERALKRSGERLQAGDIVIIHAWDGAWLADGFYQCRGISGEATDWLLDHRPRAVGIDLATLDDGFEYEPTRPAHVRLLGAEIPIFENLAHLDEVNAARFEFWGLPLRIRGLTGCPVRAIAVEP